MSLTDRQVRLAKSSGKNIKLSDRDGLYLFVAQSGSKIWRYDFRLDGKRQTFTIGKYPTLSLAEARDECDAARKLVSKGINPVEHRRTEKQKREAARTDTFGAWSKVYIDGLRDKKLSEVTVGKNEWVLGLVKEDLDHLPISEITTPKVFSALRKIEKSGRLETAKRTKSVVSSVFTLAILSGAAEFDPTYPVRRALKPPQRRHHPALVREDEFGAMLWKIDRYSGQDTTRLILQFLALTFPRPVEARLATWDEFDLKERIWRIPAERMKMKRPHDVYLTDQVRTVLHQARKLYRPNPDAPGFVFPSSRSIFKPISENTMNRALWRMGYKDLHSAHGFRSSASTILNERHYREEAIEMQLAHFEAEGKTKNVRKVYNRALYWDERVQMLKDWADLLDQLRSKEPD